MLIGSEDPAGALVTDFVLGQSTGGTAWVAGRTEKASPMLAALANGTMGHAHDFDDAAQFGHPGVALVPAALAVAEQVDASGVELLDALGLGFEVAGRIALATSDEPYERGYHGTSVFGVLGATAAAGRLLGLDEDRMRWSLGIAGSLAGGVRANFGTMTKPLHAGECGRAAVEASMLAHAGFTASPDIIEGRSGYGDTLLGHDEYDPAEMIAGLGTPYLAESGISIKKYPCCWCAHATLDGMFNILGEHALDASDVVSVRVTGSSLLRDPLVYIHPEDGLQAKFSLPYNIALALVDGRTSVASYSDRHIADPRLSEVIDKVTVETPQGWPSKIGVRIEVVTAGGEWIVRDQEYVDGDGAHPLAWEAIVDKFSDNASTVLDKEAVERTIELVEGLESQDSVRSFTGALAGGVADR
jgi:2-methylcitrate dehydratase PrpD